MNSQGLRKSLEHHQLFRWSTFTDLHPPFSNLFPDYFFLVTTLMEQKEYVAADLDHLGIYCALHPLYRALHSSKRFDCSSKWGVTAEMVLIKKRWTSLEAKLLQPRVSLKALARRVKSLCIINNLTKPMPNGNGGQGEEEKKNRYKNRSCLGPSRCMDGERTQGGESRATFYSCFRPKTIETLHI